VKFLSNADEIDKKDCIPTLIELQKKIDEEMKRWGGRGLE